MIGEDVEIPEAASYQTTVVRGEGRKDLIGKDELEGRESPAVF